MTQQNSAVTQLSGHVLFQPKIGDIASLEPQYLFATLLWGPIPLMVQFLWKYWWFYYVYKLSSPYTQGFKYCKDTHKLNTIVVRNHLKSYLKKVYLS